MELDFLSLPAEPLEQNRTGLSDSITLEQPPGPFPSPLLAIVGPTGSGKSSLAVQLATEFSGEVINCDSLQVYRQFDIGTAKLPEHERAGIPHHLIDVADPAKGFTAGDFSRTGREILAGIAARGNLPIVAGGTGFYLKALLDGLSPVPPRSENLRARLAARESRRPGSLHRVLRRIDPPSAARIHPRDIAKLMRALEIRILTARSRSAAPAPDALRGYAVLQLGLFPPRDELYAALNRRCEAMFNGGLLPEITQILASGVSRAAKPFQALGYKEGLACLEGRMNRADALAQMQRDTRRYAKRQITWFGREAGLIALRGFGGDTDVLSAARQEVARLLN